MNDAAMLLKACRVHLGEDVPRLMLADELESNYPGAAAHIRESIHFARHGKSGKRLRYASGRDYGKWLGDLLGVKVVNSMEYSDDGDFFCAGESWDQFVWVGGDYHRCTFRIRRGLPESISVTAPQLLRDVLKLFQFPLMACEVCDRKPLRDDFGGEVAWLWDRAAWPQTFQTWRDEPRTLPPMLFDRLGKTGQRWRGHYVRKADAILNLNAAAMEFGEAMFAESELRPDHSCQENAKT